MSDPFLGEIRVFCFGAPPSGWARCDGQLLPIAQHQALYSVIGTVYGGDGQTTFALPDLRGRVPVNPGTLIGPGQRGGVEFHALTADEMPAHTHEVKGSSAVPTRTSPVNSYWAASAANPYAAQPGALMHPAAISTVGQGQGHSNMQPYVAVNFCIALEGIYPSRS